MGIQIKKLKYKGVTLEIEGYYESGEPQTRSYPGTSATFEITDIRTTGNISELLEDYIKEIETKIIENE